jgi:hypothetical protein
MIAAASLLLAALVQQGAADWRPLGETPDISVAWDAGSVARRGDLVSLRLRVVRNPPVEGINAYAISQVEIDCARSTSRVGETVNYSSDDVRGEVMIEDLPWQPIPAQSFVGDLRDAVCPTAS